ncbi:hypothetical protein BDP55DRAFT_694516 [Colletotrichum godetiae]|uniref:Hsp70-like protein n=1 Tax=Colletotrichum godetiae TaxID=1209918 RepID=A0AAJ0ALV4_9PEZI|nr:uncharacterized protein BDP55DRAFT_694516 [Colletotrichum godetiae]KAK1674777.1 hypothetical protein BDP55DRAFT_694516 [Colletotrichum godetiae]
MAYQNENRDDLGHDVWGYQKESGLKSYSWTKLMLDDSALPSDYDDPNLKRSLEDSLMKPSAGKTAKDIVTDYLRGMYTTFQTAVEEQIGRENLQDFPMAMWSEKAKILTQAAAKDAGFASRSIDRIMLIPEPEAAAHMALKTSVNHVHDLVEEGSGVMVCDLGGGTVDITTYEIERISQTLRLKELCVGNGGKCGGTYVDRNLHELLAKQFGTAFTCLPYTQTGPGSEFADQFEDKKKEFSVQTASRRPMRLSLRMEGLAGMPRLADYYDQGLSKVLLTRQDMQSLFDPVVEKILQLVTDQETRTRGKRGKTTSTLVLVGGFGSLPYVKDKLKEWCGKWNIRLTTPMNGAGVEGSITTEKRCRRHYGHKVSRPYHSEKHKGYDASKRRLLDQAPATVENDRVEKIGRVEYTIDGLDVDSDSGVERIMDHGRMVYGVLLTLRIKMSNETGLLIFKIMVGEKEVGQAKLAFSSI